MVKKAWAVEMLLYFWLAAYYLLFAFSWYYESIYQHCIAAAYLNRYA